MKKRKKYGKVLLTFILVVSLFVAEVKMRHSLGRPSRRDFVQ